MGKALCSIKIWSSSLSFSTKGAEPREAMLEVPWSLQKVVDKYSPCGIARTYARFMKELVTKKRNEKAMLNEECSAMIQRKLPRKLKDPGSFTIPRTIGPLTTGKALCDLRASINAMPFLIPHKLSIRKVKPTMAGYSSISGSFS
jgi:hypothetical protein